MKKIQIKLIQINFSNKIQVNFYNNFMKNKKKKQKILNKKEKNTKKRNNINLFSTSAAIMLK